MDQLKVGGGVKDGFTMLKETDSIGVVYIKSIYRGPEDEPAEEEPAEEAPEEIVATPEPAMPE